LLGSQDSFGGGGRYDGLFSQLGGKETPAVGFAFGLERMLLILEGAKLLPSFEEKIDFYVVIQNPNYLGFANKAIKILRERGFSVISEIARRSFKAQMREANKSNARFACIIGETEFTSNSVSIKNLSNSLQQEVKFDNLHSFDTF
jgi:histidyl-tRNA synthetase